MNFNFTPANSKPQHVYPGFYQANEEEDFVVLALSPTSGIQVSGKNSKGKFDSNWWNFEDGSHWTRIAGKIELS